MVTHHGLTISVRNLPRVIHLDQSLSSEMSYIAPDRRQVNVYSQL